MFFGKTVEQHGSKINVAPGKSCSSRIDLSNELSYA
jgi:hypothetical protein